jgi:hypothetical protein
MQSPMDNGTDLEAQRVEHSARAHRSVMRVCDRGRLSPGAALHRSMRRGAEGAGGVAGAATPGVAVGDGVAVGAGAAVGDWASVGAGVDGLSAGILSGRGLRTGTTRGSTMIPRLISMRTAGESRLACGALLSYEHGAAFRQR